MQLPRVALQILLLPILALVLPLIYLVAWLREAVSDLEFKRAPVIVSSRRPLRIRRDD